MGVSFLFPDPPRDFPGRRGVRTGLRALHILAAGTLLAGHIFDLPRDTLAPWLIACLATGAVLIATELHASFAFACEVRGVLVGIKFLLVAAVPLAWDVRVALLIAALGIGVVGSHMPGRYRHRLLWMRGRVAVDERKG